MQRNLERVISIVDENAVIEGTTIVNTVYDREGYRISHISMAKGTYMSPERFRSPTLLYVNKGVLRVVVKRKDGRREAVIKPGQSYYRLANEFAGYYAEDDDLILTEIVLRTDSEVAMRIVPYTVQDINHLVHYEPGQISRSHLVNDEFFQLNMMAFSESEQKEVHTDMPVLLYCLEGKASVIHGEGKISLSKGKAFVMPKNYQCTITLTSHTKMTVLHLTDKEAFLL